ncbi:Hypp3942 [Branchiostoma lanceolatum]|uniref:Hypp3942 protein n=1 Tax=Branchiostoma lanceolatum TaxID=7740 RepID=A0A8K0A604_BRALA|nr:Hypp3942 [Branchiostoma lanceolatum]
MLRVCEKLRKTDAKGRRYGLARTETGYLRALVDAMADMDRLAEVELLKSLGDVNLEKGRLGKDVGKFNRALALYMAAVVRCDHRDQGEGIEHRYEYTEKLLERVSSKGSQEKAQSTEDKEMTTPAKVAKKFQDIDKKLAIGHDTDFVLVGYAKLMVEAIVNDSSMLEVEAMKSLGDVYLKRGTETGDTRDLTKAIALYNKALARCHNVQGTVVLVHRLLLTAKIRQDITAGIKKRSARRQRQQDVRGREGHFSPFSAAPPNDVIKRLHVSYRRYIQTADRDLGNGDLDAAEQNLAAALKLVHDRNKPDKAREADCLSRLGDVYVERGKRTGEGRTFTQAAALYNASMARTVGDKQSFVTRLQETERQFLRNTCNTECEPCPYSSTLDHIKELENTCARVKSQLDKIHQEHNPYQYDEDDPVVREVEIKRAEAIKNLFKRITAERQNFIQVLTDECNAKLGPPPCKYAFIGLGSQATELVTPYSDLEFAILIEEGKGDDDDTRRYFLNLTHYLHLKVINLGETILPAMAIPSLNDFLSQDPEKDWFFDSVTPRGFAFDGFMPWASKTPFGRDKTKTKPPVSLIQTPAKLAEYQHLHIAVAEGYHLSDILRRATYLTGDESLVEDYVKRINRSVDRSPVLSRLLALLALKDNIRQIEDTEITGQLLDVKKEIYRFPSVAVDVLSVCCDIRNPSVWGMIEELHNTERISQEDAHHLTVLISISAELRLRTYIANGGQKDRLSPLTEMKIQLDKHDVDDMLLHDLGDQRKAISYFEQSLKMRKTVYGENTAHPGIANSLCNIGTCWADLGDKTQHSIAMLRVCEKLREADAKGRRYGLARAETGYLRSLVDAMADMDRLAEVELLKSLGDVNLEKGRLGKDVGKFNRALALYMAAVVRCDHREQGEGIEHRYEYTERLVQGVSSKMPQCKEQTTEDKETTSPAKLAETFQNMDKKWAADGNTDYVLDGYAELMVEGIVKDDSMLEVEAMKSLGDVYLKRGTETVDTRDLTKATALYNKALARCHNVQGTVVIVHRLLHTAKIRQDITSGIIKRSARTQRQQDVRGRKGHVSATPSSNVDEDGKRQVHNSYRRHIQAADRDLGNGDLDAAEQNLAAALKLVHDRNKPDKAREADCLSRLGDVYVERGKRTGEGRTFTQAAALYNASMARTDGDRQNMVTRLQKTERQFLRNTCNLECEPCPYSSALDHKKELKNTRARVKSQLDTIHQEHNPYQYDEDDPVARGVEIKRAEAIRDLFKSITAERQEFIQVLTDECIAKLGPPPCKYAFIGLGSQATELVTPYSDLEFAILIEEGKDDDDDTRSYFPNLTHYLHLKVINLGETILPAMAIPSLNDFLSDDPEKDWFFDAVTPRGFAFDGFMPWASKTPFGRDETKSKPSVSLIQTPAKLAEYQNLHIALAEGYHLSDILRRVTYLTGDESLVGDYLKRVNRSPDRSPVLSRLQALAARLSAALTLWENIRQIKNVEPTGQLLDVKKEIYRFPSVAVDVLSVCCGITIPSVWGIIEELHKTQRISQEDAHHLTVLISISAELRLRTYIANGGQKDTLSPLTEMKIQIDKHDVDDTFVKSVFYIPDSKLLFRSMLE